MKNKLQELKGETKLKIHKDIYYFYDIMNIRMDEDPFSKNAQGIVKNYHKVLLLKKILQIKPQVKNLNITYYDLYYTVSKNGDEKQVVIIQCENDSIIYNDIIPNHYIGRKNDNEILR